MPGLARTSAAQPRLGRLSWRPHDRGRRAARPADREGPRRALPDRGAARAGRHRSRLQGPPPHPGAPRGAQGAARAVREHPRPAGALPPGGRGAGRALPPQHRHRDRFRGGRGDALPGHGAPRGARSGRADRAGGHPARSGVRDRAAGAHGALLRALARAGAPGPEAAEHLRPGAGRGLRSRRGARLRAGALPRRRSQPRPQAHQGGRADRDAGVHGARAGFRRGGRRARGRVLHRRGALRDADRS